MTPTIFYRQHPLTGRFECRWRDRDGAEWVSAERWQDFRRQWMACGYVFVESDFQDGQDRR